MAIVTRQKLAEIERTLSLIGSRITDRGGMWAIGGTVALCVHNPMNDAVRASQGYSGDLLVHTTAELQAALADDPTTRQQATKLGTRSDSLLVGFQIGKTGASGVGYGVQPSADMVEALRSKASPYTMDQSQATIRSLLLHAALETRVEIPGLNGTVTSLLSPGGVALTALATGIAPNAFRGHFQRELFGPALFAAAGAPDAVRDTVHAALDPVVMQAERRLQPPHEQLRSAIAVLVDLARTEAILSEDDNYQRGFEALHAATAPFVTVVERHADRGLADR